MKILLFGKNGQLGWELQRSLAFMGELVTLDTDDQELCGDFTQPDNIIQTLHSVSPNVIVNAAAYTVVDKAESEIDLAHIINSHTPKILAQEAQKLGAWLIHYSTDYVFDGNGVRPWKETDPAIPLNVYGSTKLEGEQAILSSNCKHLIFRTSWVYSVRGRNFIKNMIHLMQNRDSLTVIDDQIGSPTGAELLADVTAHSIRTVLWQPQLSGLYHVSAKGETSWYNYANFIFDKTLLSPISPKIKTKHIQPVTTDTFSQTAKRPKNSRLDTKKFEKAFNVTLPLWQTGVTRTLSEILDNNYDST